MEYVNVMRTKEELDNGIIFLKAERERLPEFSFFGDNNWKETDRCIELLNKSYTESAFYVLDADGQFYDCIQWLNGEMETDEFFCE